MKLQKEMELQHLSETNGWERLIFRKNSDWAEVGTSQKNEIVVIQYWKHATKEDLSALLASIEHRMA